MDSDNTRSLIMYGKWQYTTSCTIRSMTIYGQRQYTMKLIISKDDNTEAGNDVSLMIFIRFVLRSSIFRDVMLPNISYPFPHPVILFPYNTSFSKYLRCRKTPFGRWDNLAVCIFSCFSFLGWLIIANRTKGSLGRKFSPRSIISKAGEVENS